MGHGRLECHQPDFPKGQLLAGWAPGLCHSLGPRAGTEGVGDACLRNSITPHLWDNEIWGPQILRQLARGSCDHRGFSLSRSFAFSKTFAKFSADEGELAAPFASFPGSWAWEGGGDLGRLGPSSESSEETRGAGFLWGLRPRRPADRRVRPRQHLARRGGRDVVGGRLGRRGGGGERVGRRGGEGRGEASQGGARGLQGEEAEAREREARAGAEMRERSE